MFGSGKGLLFSPKAMEARLSPETEDCFHPFEKARGRSLFAVSVFVLMSFSLKATLSLGAFGDTRDTMQVTCP